VRDLEDSIIEQFSKEVTPGKKRGGKAKGETPIVDIVVRRSNRARANSMASRLTDAKSKTIWVALLHHQLCHQPP
jgi:hypothetical protein